MPIVTVGVCVRNGEQYIKRAINGILKQDYPHHLMELIFVDDGSEDKTLSIINNYVKKTDIDIKIFSGKWKGIGFSRNVIVTNSIGDYVIWVDSDMVIPKYFVNKQVNFMENNKKVGLATGTIRIHSKDNLILMLEHAPFIAYYSKIKIWEKGNPTKLPGAAGTISRVEILRDLGGFDETISGAGEDIDIAYKIQNAGWLIYQTETEFYESHGNMCTLKDLWKKYLWRGSSSYYFFQRKKIHFSILRMNPIAGFISGVLAVPRAYSILSNKLVIFCPLHFAFKMIGWLYGYTKAKNFTLANKRRQSHEVNILL